jgi:aldose 1-epimerase
MTAEALVKISNGESHCLIKPQLGASIVQWTVGNQDMLRRSDDKGLQGDDPRNLASFPLVPFSNRIGFGRFTWAGEDMQLDANFLPEPHAIHGTGWRAAWDVIQQCDDSVTLTYSHSISGGWHWPFEAKQHIVVTADGLMMQLSARNLFDRPVPLAFGHHPYFDSAGATLHFNASQIWHTGQDGLPDQATEPSGQYDFANGDPVAGRALDNGYSGWDGKAQIHWQDRPLMLEVAADMKAAVVFIPKAEDYFCFEPVPHIINALNMLGHDPQMPVIEPGELFETSICFTAKAA